MIKNFIIAIFLAIITVSCNDPNSLELEKLRSENTKLKDSLSELKKNEWNYKMLIGIPNGKFRIGEKNKIVFLLHDFKELPKYDVYKVEGEKEIKISSPNLSKFDFEFIPKNISDNRVKLKIKVPNSNVEILNETMIPLE